jgi:uncharacterized SAM-binding protein YcdF (DUF218 family)
VIRAIKRSVVVACFGALALAAGFVAFATSMMGYAGSVPVSGDAVVVLTGGELRVREGFRLFAEGTGRRILISGVNRVTSKDDLRRFSGVTPLLFDCCVDVGHVALDTVGNAAETREWLRTWGFKRLVVVTSNYHMPRSLMELGRALPDIELVPHAVVSRNYQPGEWWRHPGAIKLVLSEYFKFLPASGKWLMAQAWPVAPSSGGFGHAVARPATPGLTMAPILVPLATLPVRRGPGVSSRASLQQGL